MFSVDTLQVDDMLREHEWINVERQYFGVSGTAYDFTANDTHAAKARLAHITQNHTALSKKVNMKVREKLLCMILYELNVQTLLRCWYQIKRELHYLPFICILRC
jgi:structural maintenance of chromosome 2